MMTLSPVLPVFACFFIGAGVLIRLKKHPKIPVITLCILMMLLLFILGLTAIDRSVSLSAVSDEGLGFWKLLCNLLVLHAGNVSLDVLYEAFDILKVIVILLATASVISLFVETGLLLRHKKERNDVHL